MEYGLIGEHLGHSYSKLIQEKLLDNYTYDLHPIPKDELEHFMTEKSFKAINVTIPYKRDVIPYLTHMDDASQKIGAVNTVVNKNNELYGYNTDYYGFKYMVEKHNVPIQNNKVLVLGNGGASQAIQAVIQDLGASEMLVTDIVQSDGIYTLDEIYANHTDVTVVVNTTPCGMYPNVGIAAADITKFKNCQAVLDCIYNPQQTQITLDAKHAGIPVHVTGLEMLVGQAKRALEYFKDIEIADNEIDRIYREILTETANLIWVSDDEVSANSIAKQLNKKCVIFQEEKQAYENNQVLLITKEQLKQYEDAFESNGFIIDTQANDVISAFNDCIQAY